MRSLRSALHVEGQAVLLGALRIQCREAAVTATIPSGRSAAQVCTDAADYFDTIDKFLALVRIEDGDGATVTAADIAGRDDEVQRDLRAVAREIESLQHAVRLLVDRFHSDTPMGPNVVDLPDVRWRILPPHVADAVQRAINAESDNGRHDDA